MFEADSILATAEGCNLTPIATCLLWEDLDEIFSNMLWENLDAIFSNMLWEDLDAIFSNVHQLFWGCVPLKVLEKISTEVHLRGWVIFHPCDIQSPVLYGTELLKRGASEKFTYSRPTRGMKKHSSKVM